jgi:hypothetical protein
MKHGVSEIFVASFVASFVGNGIDKAHDKVLGTRITASSYRFAPAPCAPG